MLILEHVNLDGPAQGSPPTPRAGPTAPLTRDRPDPRYTRREKGPRRGGGRGGETGEAKASRPEELPQAGIMRGRLIRPLVVHGAVIPQPWLTGHGRGGLVRPCCHGMTPPAPPKQRAIDRLFGLEFHFDLDYIVVTGTLSIWFVPRYDFPANKSNLSKIQRMSIWAWRRCCPPQSQGIGRNRETL